MLFEKLPEISECCFCIPLQYGVVFIALYCIILNVVTLFESTVVVCYMGIHNEKCEFQPNMKYIDFLGGVIGFLFIAPSILLIVGAFLKKRILITIFLYVFAIACVAEVVMDIPIVVVSTYMPHCDTERIAFGTCLLVTFLHICLSIYFMVVVKSFRTSIPAGSSTDINRGESKCSIILIDGRRESVNKRSLYILDPSPGEKSNQPSDIKPPDTKPSYIKPPDSI